METCRWCGKVVGYYGNREAHIMKRIRDQLGSLTDIERRDDPVLSQLGRVKMISVMVGAV